MKIAFIAAFSSDRISGPTNSVTNLAKSCNGNVFTNIDSQEKFIINDIGINTKQEFFKNVDNFTMVIVTGIFDRNNLDIFKILLSKKIKYVVSLRGNLIKESFKRSKLKKIIYMAFYGNRIINEAHGIHFLSKEEQSKTMILKNKNSIISRNGVESFSELSNFQERKNIILFIGRIDTFHKGIDRLICQIQANASYLSKKNFKIDLYGPSNKNDKKNIHKLIEKNNLKELISLHDPVSKDERNKLLQNSKYFIHTSRLEGQPQAVLEAMAHGCIPLITDECNMSSDIKANKCGFIVNCEEDENIFRAIGESNSQVISNNCVLFAKKYLNWKNIGKDFLNDI